MKGEFIPGAEHQAARGRARFLKRPIAWAIVALGLVLAAAALLLPPRLEREIRARIVESLSRHGLVARLQSVDLGISPPLRLAGLSIEKHGSGSLLVRDAEVSFRLRGRGLLGRARIRLDRVTIQGPAAFSAELAPTLWDVEAVPPDGLRAVLREPSQGLEVTWSPTSQGGRLETRATAAPAGRLLSVWRAGVPLLDAGVVDGALRCEATRQATTCELEIDGRGMRLAALSNGEAEEQPAFGLPADVRLFASGSWRPAEGALDLPSLRLSTGAVSLSGALALRDALRDPSLTLAVDVARMDFAQLLGASGLDQPQAVAAFGPGAPGELGSVALGVRVEGRLADAASFKVVQKVEFSPPPRALPALERLRGDFAHPVTRPDGSRTIIEVSPASPDFIPLAEVPQLLVQTLLLGEDAGFFAHRGIDLAELPAAILTNWARGEPARGASTITQQLARNLFLSREKRLGRKLHELCLALLLESRLSKQRILEIYLNVIEWGPRLHGLRPASRRYFSREPADLTPKQMAFLVALIPGPLKYQRSFADGTPSPGFLRLVDNLLAKLRSLSALDEAAYQSALAEPLVVATD